MYIKIKDVEEMGRRRKIINYGAPKIKQKKNESDENFRERMEIFREIRRYNGSEEYKSELIKRGLDYVEIELTKSNGNTVNLVIPNCIFKVLNKRELDRLLSVD